MSAREMAFRLSRRAQMAWARRRPASPAPAPKSPRTQELPPLRMIDVEPGPYLSAAEAAVNGSQPCLGLDSAPFGPAFGWTRDPKSGIRAPLSFGMTLNYRNEALVGDIKYLWEPNRHLHFPTLAQAYLLSGDVRYLDTLGIHIKSWIEQNPYRLGPNWASALEAAIRLINWSIAWRLLGGRRAIDAIAPDRGFPGDQWLRSIYEHLEFVTGLYSRYSSANNHLVGEAAGVYIGCLTWPFWDDCARWRTQAREILVAECQRQITPDGVNREQATSYQAFTLEFLLLAGASGSTAGDEFPDSYWHRVRLAAEFIAELLDAGGNVPQIGDSDDALVVELAPDAHRTLYTSLIFATGRLLREKTLEDAAGSAGDRARWICALAGEEVERFELQGRGEAGRRYPPGTVRSFPDGGYHLLYGGEAGASAVRVLFDTGPLGYLSIAAHGHADALAILLWVDGREVLIDSGTYAYHTQASWRSYFRGTRAHNTATIDESDQSQPGGSFMWLRHASARCNKVENGAATLLVEGEHDGYHRLTDPVTHTRKVTLTKSGKRLSVADHFDCRGRHRCEIWWHFSEECNVTVTNRHVRVALDRRVIGVEVNRADCEIIERRGCEDPRGGWRSRRFGVKEPTQSIAWGLAIEGSAEIHTTFLIDTAA
jgi:hypothetical protein